ncbi:MAG TPA: hypothetical protein VK638_50055 [Edaphobacter sp.]|nr:hypothetical protein [Edaphobacter sp.]
MRVASVSIIPSPVGRGSSATIFVELDAPAPAGGAEVAISADFHNGSQDNINPLVQGIPIPSGTLRGKSTFQIEPNPSNPTNDITFYASTFNSPAQSVTLGIV